VLLFARAVVTHSQVVGHTALLYRPSSPPFIDLAGEVAKSSGGNTDEE